MNRVISNRLETGVRGIMFLTVLALCVVQASVMSVAWAVEEESSLSGLGLELESALKLDGPARLEAFGGLEHALTSLRSNNSDLDKGSAAWLLSGAIRYELGDYDGAREAYEKARDRGGAYADDAAFAEIEALEAAGKDEKAAKAWSKWQRKYPDSPLRGEAHLAKAW